MVPRSLVLMDLACGACYCYRIMTALETIVEDLKRLPPARIEDAAWFVHGLVENANGSWAAVLKHTATALSEADVAEMERAIAEACEEVDEHVW